MPPRNPRRDGIEANALNILDVLMSADDQVEALRELDLPAMEERLRTDHDVLEANQLGIASAVAEMADQIGIDVDVATGDHMLLWPAPDQPAGTKQGQDEGKLVGVLPEGLSVFNFTSGEVNLAGGITQELSQSLNNLDEEFVRSMHIGADNHIMWYIPGESSGRYQNQMRSDSVRNIRMQQLLVFAWEPTAVRLLASTGDEIGIEPTGPSRAMGRVTWDPDSAFPSPTPPGPPQPDNGDPRHVVDDTWTTLNWSSEYAAQKPTIQTTEHVHTMNLKSIGLSIDAFDTDPNGDPTADVQIAILAKETILGGSKPDILSRHGYVSGFTPSDDVTIPADPSDEANPRIFEFDPYPHHYLELRARSTSATENAVVMGSFMGNTS